MLPQVQDLAVRWLEHGSAVKGRNTDGKLAILTIEHLGAREPGSAPLLKAELLSRRTLPGNLNTLLEASAGLAPGHREIDTYIGVKLADEAINPQQRRARLFAAALPGAGPQVIAAVDRAVVSAPSKQEQDKAVDEAAKIGPPAVEPIEKTPSQAREGPVREESIQRRSLACPFRSSAARPAHLARGAYGYAAAAAASRA